MPPERRADDGSTSRLAPPHPPVPPTRVETGDSFPIVRLDRWWNRPILACGGVLLLGLVVLLAGFVTGGVLALHVPEALEVGEPFIVSAAYYAGTGGQIYAPVRDLPFLHNNYNPLVQLLAAPILARTGPSFVPMRAITFGAALALCGVLFLAARAATRSTGVALGAALLPLSCGFVFPWLCLGRVDVFAALASVSAVAWAFTHAESGPRRRALWIPLGWIAFASKQTMIAGPAAILLVALLRRRGREALIQGAIYGAGCAAFAGVAQLFSGGQYWLHAITYNAEHDRGGLWPHELSPAQLAWGIGPAPLLALVLALAFFRAARPWSIWMAIATAWAFFLVRKSGSHVHYFLEPVCAMAVSAAVAFRYGVVRSPRWARAAPLLLLALAAGVALQARHHHLPVGRYLRELATRADPVPAEIRRRVAQAPRTPLLIAKLGSLSIEAGRPAIFDIADFVRLQELGRWSADDRLIPLIREKWFPLIGVAEFPPGDLAAPHFDAGRLKGFREALEANYRPLAWRVEDPKSRQRGSFWEPKP